MFTETKSSQLKRTVGAVGLLVVLVLPLITLGQSAGRPSLDTEFYILQPGDAIQVSVFNEPDLSVRQELDKDGVMIIPLLGRTDLSGKTLREAESYLETLFVEQEFLIDPQVTVSIANYAQQVFYIFGEVNAPGAKTFPEGRQWLDILEVITMAGDLSRYAKSSEIILRRPMEGGAGEKKITINIDDVIRGKERSQEELVKIYPGDILFVPERLF
jgi:polysaccharide export outer membrane protein